MKKKLSAVALASAAALVLAGCGPAEEAPPAAEAQDITFWVFGGDTPDELREFLKTEYAEVTGGTLTIEEQGWGDLPKLTTALPDAENTPDVTEIGNTWSPTFTNAGAFSDLSGLYQELGGSDLVESFVAAGEVDGKQYALPYYFGSRYMFYRKDIWQANGKEVPTTLAEFNQTVADLRTDTLSGFYIGGQDWRNGVSWIFANGGELAVKDGDKWVGALSSANTIKGLQQFQALFENASNAPSTEFDSTPWVNINDNAETGKPEAATIIAPGWARWSIGDAEKNDAGEDIRVWNDETFGIFGLPGANGGLAPVFAGGSNIAISKASKNQEGAQALLKIIFGAEYQTLLAKNGLGPGNLKYAGEMGDDEFAKVLVETAAASKLTPAAPGWAAVEGAKLLEEFFGKIAEGGDVAALAGEYDSKMNELLN